MFKRKLLASMSSPPRGRKCSGDWTPSAASSLREYSAASRQEEVLEGLDRLGRLNTDLANERTLLAWIRTNLAVMRTCFAMINLSGIGKAWEDSVRVAQVLMTTLMLLLSVTGAWRYYKLKGIIYMTVPPKYFGLISLKPTNFLVIVSSITVAIGMYATGWKHR